MYKNSEYGEGEGPIVISNVVCEGWERSLTDCEHYNYGSFYCSHDQTIGIFCHNGKSSLREYMKNACNYIALSISRNRV